MLSSRNKVAKGEPFRPDAGVHNELVDFVTTAQNASGGLPYGATRESYLPVFIYDAAASHAPGTVVGFSTPVSLATAPVGAMASPTFVKSAPVTARWAVAHQGMFQGERSECTLVGVAWAQVNVTDAAHAWADVNLGGSLVSGADPGYAKILYKPAGTGVMWCCLQLGFNEGTGGGGGGDNTCDCNFVKLQFRYAQLDGRLDDEYANGQTIEERFADIMECHGCTVTCGECEFAAKAQLTMSGFSNIPDVTIGNAFNYYAFTGTNLNDTFSVPIVAPGTTPRWMLRQDVSDWFTPVAGESIYLYRELYVDIQCVDDGLGGHKLEVFAAIRFYTDDTKTSEWAQKAFLIDTGTDYQDVTITACAPDADTSVAFILTESGFEDPTNSFTITL